MPWIRVIDEKDANEELRAAIDAVKGSRGKLSNILAVHSLHPQAMRAHMDLYLAILFCGSKLSRAEREMIAVVVSSQDACPYCIAHHAEALRHYWKDDDVEHLIEEGLPTSPSDRQRALCEYARKLTTCPGEMSEADVEALRNHGLDDHEILTTNLIVSYFNFVNRIALGLGVEFTEEEVKGYDV